MSLSSSPSSSTSSFEIANVHNCRLTLPWFGFFENSVSLDACGSNKSGYGSFHVLFGGGVTITLSWLGAIWYWSELPNYLPMEVFKTVEGQRYSKWLNERKIITLLKVTSYRFIVLVNLLIFVSFLSFCSICSVFSCFRMENEQSSYFSCYWN